MEVKVFEKTKDLLKLEIVGETHTLCNLLREELWNQNVDIAAYHIEHPLVSNPVLVVSSPNPKKSLEKAIDILKKTFSKLRKEAEKLK